MNDAQTLAAMQAVRDALDRKITEQKRKIMSGIVAETGAKSFLTDLGLIAVVIPNPSILFDEERLLEFADDQGEVETIRRVRDNFRKCFTVEGGEVIYEPTGEAIPWAKPKQGSRYLRTTLTDHAKERAYELLGDNSLIEPAMILQVGDQ